MSSRTPSGSEDGFTPGAGNSTDQHITGAAETGDFVTDEAPTADTPAHGSTTAGLNTDDLDHTDDASGGRGASSGST